jgi:hypothetical protein
MTDICISGAAEGADIAWGEFAKANGHSVIHWSFKGHKPSITEDVYYLTDDQLFESNTALVNANLSLKRKYPTNSKHVDKLLQRDYWQVIRSDSVYIVSWFVNDSSLMKIHGGSAWAAQIFLNRCNLENIKPNIYLFEQNVSKWYSWDNEWNYVLSPPIPSGTYAGIGTRDLNLPGLEAIRAAYG